MSVQRAIRQMFNGPKKGETFELKAALVLQYPEERKEGIKRVIKAMTVGKDVSALFPDVLKNIATRDLEQKKLVYLYLMNYAKTNPELCILAVNTFVQDTEDPNPLVRALAIRTMGCIRVNKMVDYMHIPLKRTLSDDNPYVRKTAAICVAKLYDLNPEMCVEQGFLDQLKRLIDDLNPAVVSNAINALSEINQIDPSQGALKVDSALLKKMLLALNECTEWGRITILTTLSEYRTSTPQEAAHILERVTPQLQHANPLVVLTSIKAILTHVERVGPAVKAATMKKLLAPLILLIGTLPEIQFISLRNIRVILERYPELLLRELRIFYIKYNDPLYLKLEKIEIMVRLANFHNYKILLNELKEYLMEIDPEFVRRSVQAVGQVAIKLGPAAASKAVELLVELVKTRGEYVFNDAVCVLKDVLRKYLEDVQLLGLVIPHLVDSYHQLDETNAVASFVWMLGAYPSSFGIALQRIMETYYSDETLENTFANEDEYALQVQLLVTAVRVSVLQPSSWASAYLQKVLTICTEKLDNPDIRDRAFLYWRLVSSGDSAILAVVKAQITPIELTIPKLPEEKVTALLAELGTLSLIYHEPAVTFSLLRPVVANGIAAKGIDELQQIAKTEIVANAGKSETLLDFDDPEPEPLATQGGSLDELNDLFNFSAPPESSGNKDIMDLFNTVGTPSGLTSVENAGGMAGVTSGLQNMGLEDSQSSKPEIGSKKPSDDLLSLF